MSDGHSVQQMPVPRPWPLCKSHAVQTSRTPKCCCSERWLWHWLYPDRLQYPSRSGLKVHTPARVLTLEISISVPERKTSSREENECVVQEFGLTRCLNHSCLKMPSLLVNARSACMSRSLSCRIFIESLFSCLLSSCSRSS